MAPPWMSDLIEWLGSASMLNHSDKAILMVYSVSSSSGICKMLEVPWMINNVYLRAQETEGQNNKRKKGRGRQ